MLQEVIATKVSEKKDFAHLSKQLSDNIFFTPGETAHFCQQSHQNIPQNPQSTLSDDPILLCKTLFNSKKFSTSKDPLQTTIN